MTTSAAFIHQLREKSKTLHLLRWIHLANAILCIILTGLLIGVAVDIRSFISNGAALSGFGKEHTMDNVCMCMCINVNCIHQATIPHSLSQQPMCTCSSQQCVPLFTASFFFVTQALLIQHGNHVEHSLAALDVFQPHSFSPHYYPYCLEPIL